MYFRKTLIALTGMVLLPNSASSADLPEWYLFTKPLSPVERAYPGGLQQTPKHQKIEKSKKTDKSQKSHKPHITHIQPNAAFALYPDLQIVPDNPRATKATIVQVNKSIVRVMQNVDEKLKKHSDSITKAWRKANKADKTADAAATNADKAMKQTNAVSDKLETVVKDFDKHIQSQQQKAVAKFKANKQLEEVAHEAKNYTDKIAAVGVALSSLNFDSLPNRFTLAMGTGSFNQKTALAIGMGYTNKDGRMRVSVSTAFADKQYAVGFGVSYSFDIKR